MSSSYELFQVPLCIVLYFYFQNMPFSFQKGAMKPHHWSIFLGVTAPLGIPLGKHKSCSQLAPSPYQRGCWTASSAALEFAGDFQERKAQKIPKNSKAEGWLWDEAGLTFREGSYSWREGPWVFLPSRNGTRCFQWTLSMCLNVCPCSLAQG